MIAKIAFRELRTMKDQLQWAAEDKDLSPVNRGKWGEEIGISYTRFGICAEILEDEKKWGEFYKEWYSLFGITPYDVVKAAKKYMRDNLPDDKVVYDYQLDGKPEVYILRLKGR